ncbi:efflux RND transporter periplasmic adaptor subunit [candidate division WOR-3 bacterium]|nr:efflux RND transporter periplasmic adaptor subunit [candidate division WOR-3 bacterium]
MKHKLTLLTAVIGLFVAVGCGPKGAPKKRNLQSVAFETVRRQTVTRTIGLLGTVEGEKQATAMSKITGKVTSIARPEGSWVNEDDAIAYVVNDIPGMDYQPGPVRAPIAGYVGKVYVEVGQTVAPGVPVAVVANYGNRVTVKARISDHDLRFVKTGAPADISVTAFSDTSFTGRVTAVTPVLDQLSRTATVELTVNNTGRKLVPGMACGVQLTLEQKKDVIALPRIALFTNGYTRVAVLDDSTARFRDVTTGLVGDRLIEVTSGLEPGEHVVTTGKERIEDGGRVIPVEVGQR